MEVTCNRCGKMFTAHSSKVKRGGGKFCSRACYTEHQAEHPHTAAGNRAAEPVKNGVCAACGEHFKYPAKRPRTFCSRACYRTASRITKTCIGCGEVFSVSKSNAERYRFCSLDCKRENAGGRDVTCETCGETFRDSTNRRRHCSEGCRRPPVIIECRTCGESFRALPGDDDRQFCSMRCYRKHTGETRPERFVRESLERRGLRFVQEWPIPGTRQLCDFLLTDLGVAIEVDGVFWHSSPACIARDERKTRNIESHGYTVVRIPAGRVSSDFAESAIDRIVRDHGIS